MTKEITDKVYILSLKGNVRIWLDAKEFEAIKVSMSQDLEFMEIGGKLISKNAILYIFPRNEIEDADKIKQGEWKCKYDEWHTRGQECGHMLL